MIIFDLDCLADCEHRRHFITKPISCKYIFTDSVAHGEGCILTGHYAAVDRWVKWNDGSTPSFRTDHFRVGKVTHWMPLPSIKCIDKNPKK